VRRLSIIWARDLADNPVKGFIVENKTTPGFTVEKIQNKIAAEGRSERHITLKDVRVPEENRLQGATRSRHAKVLKMTRYAVAWMATGMRDGRLRGGTQVQPGSLAVRQAHRIVPACSGPSRRMISTSPPRSASSCARLHCLTKTN